MRFPFSDKGLKLIPARFRVPEFGNSPERERWRAGLSFVSLAQTCIACFIAIEFTYGVLRRQQHIGCTSRQGGLGDLVAT
jgi:hypothetical protein